MRQITLSIFFIFLSFCLIINLIWLILIISNLLSKFFDLSLLLPYYDLWCLNLSIYMSTLLIQTNLLSIYCFNYTIYNNRDFTSPLDQENIQCAHYIYNSRNFTSPLDPCFFYVHAISTIVEILHPL